MTTWVETGFAEAEFGDQRLTARLMKIATPRALRPSLSLPQCFENAPELDNMYNFCDNAKATHQAILESHYKATRTRIAEHKIVSAIQDTTYVNYTHHPATTGCGYRHDDKHQGLLRHTTLATTPGRIPLGLIEQPVIYRDQEDYGQREKRQDLPIEPKESYKWMLSQEAMIAIQKAGPSTLVVNVMDREGAPQEPPKLRQAARWIAPRGGFLGRKPDGEPGVTVMWRGLQRLFDMVGMWRIFNHSAFMGTY